MIPPHPSTSCGKFPNMKTSASIGKHIKGIIEKNLKAVPNETKNNHVSVGGVGSADYSYAYYNPHNARFYFKYLKTDPLTDPRLNDLKTINKSELCHDNFKGCRIVIKKNLIEVTNKINKERRFKISGSADERYSQTVEAVVVLEREVVCALKEFIVVFGGESDCVCVKMWIPDNKILHDRIIDSLPDELTFRNDVVKKVYVDVPKNVEVSSPVQAAHTFRNLALYDYAPMIAAELEELRKEIMQPKKSFLNPLENVKLGLSCFPADVFKSSDNITALSDLDKASLTEWIFETFGGVA